VVDVGDNRDVAKVAAEVHGRSIRVAARWTRHADAKTVDYSPDRTACATKFWKIRDLGYNAHVGGRFRSPPRKRVDGEQFFSPRDLFTQHAFAAWTGNREIAVGRVTGVFF